MDEPCESFIEPAPKPDLIAIFERDGYLAYLAALPFPPPHPAPKGLPESIWGPKSQAELAEDPWWQAGDYRTEDCRGWPITMGWGRE